MNLFSKLFSKKHKLLRAEDKHTKTDSNAIGVLYGDVVIDGSKCDECGYCIKICPVGAISFKN